MTIGRPINKCIDGLSDPRLFHGIFTRNHGVSPAPWDSLNVGYHCGDAAENVRQNRRNIKEALQIERLISLGQVHGAKVFTLTEIPDKDLEIEGFDGLVTDLKGPGLMIQQADCQAVLLFDPVRPAVGIVHVGWRGAVAKIIRAAVTAMVENYSSRPADLLAAISPALGPCCAEFRNFKTELPMEMHGYQARPEHFDFRAISRDQLQTEGVQANRITVAGQCTVCSPEFFSYRRDGNCGRSASIIGLR